MKLSMPQIGLGVFRSEKNTYDAIRYALDIGYRHIDTAKVYDNEEEVGRAIKDSKIPREKIFVTTKLWMDDFGHASKGLENSLKRLDMDYVDAYLIHWPGTSKDLRFKAWESLCQLEQKKLTHSIGVSNFLPCHLEEFVAAGFSKPRYNQIEIHPWFTQKESVEYCQQAHIQIISWAPLYRGKAFEEPLLQQLSAKYAKTPAQIILRWHLEKGYNLIPKSVTPSRIKENFELFDFSLSPAHIAEIDALNNGTHLSFDPLVYNG